MCTYTPTGNYIYGTIKSALLGVLLISLIMAASYLFFPIAKLISNLLMSSNSKHLQRTNQLYPMTINTPLPVFEEKFVGREKDMESITSLLKFYGHLRIIAILGMPGVGKSTTAKQLAHQERGNGTMVMYVDLSGMENVNGIKTEIVEQAFGYRAQSVPEINGKFKQWVYGCSKPLLLILDNYDQLVHYHDQADPAYLEFGKFVVSELYEYLGDTTVVITTRKEPTLFRHLSRIDAWNHTLQPLSDDSSVNLLANHLQISNNYELQQLRPIAELIGGVPIALGIAAVLIRNEGIDSTFEKLKNSLEPLSPKDLSEIPNQSVSACIRLSYDYLNDSVKMCGQYLSCFPASFSEQAAVSILSLLPNQSRPSVQVCLNVLRRWSLLQLSMYDDGTSRYNFHKLLKDFFSGELSSHEEQLQVRFDSMFCHHYTEVLQDFRAKYLEDSRTALAETTVDRHNFLHMLHILERSIEKNISNVGLDASVDAVMDAMSLKYGSILAHLFTSFEIHQSLTRIVEYADRRYQKKFKESVLPQEFSRYITAVVFWAARYAFAQEKLPGEGSLSVRSLEKKIGDYISNISAENCSFPDVILPSTRILGIICYDMHHHTKLSLCPKGNETISMLREKLFHFDHTKCTDADLGELGLAHFELKNMQTAIRFMEMHIEAHSLEGSPMEDPHIFITLCKAYSHSGRDNKCDKLCERIISGTTGVPVSGKNFKLFGLLFMYYWKHNKLETSKEAKRVSEELLVYFSNAPKRRGYRRNIRCLLAGIATYQHHIQNYSAAIDIYHIVVESSFSKSEYHNSRLLVGAPNNILSIFSQFRVGIAEIAEWKFDGLNNIDDAITRALNIAGNTTLHEYISRIALEDEELIQIVAMGSTHLLSIVCSSWWSLMLRYECLWQQLLGMFTHSKSSVTQLLYNQLCGFEDPYGKSFDFWRQDNYNSALPLCICTLLLLVLFFRYTIF